MQLLTVEHVLNTIKSRHDLKSDYAIGKQLDISLPVISGWRHGKSLPDERMCQKLAAAAGFDPLVLTASMQAQRSKTTEARSMWEAIAERLQGAAHGLAAVIFAVSVSTFLIAQDADAASAAGHHTLSADTVNSLYIVSSQ